MYPELEAEFSQLIGLSIRFNILNGHVGNISWCGSGSAVTAMFVKFVKLTTRYAKLNNVWKSHFRSISRWIYIAGIVLWFPTRWGCSSANNRRRCLPVGNSITIPASKNIITKIRFRCEWLRALWPHLTKVVVSDAFFQRDGVTCHTRPTRQSGCCTENYLEGKVIGTGRTISLL